MDEETIRRVRAFIVTNFLFGDESRLPGDADSLLESGVIDSTGVLELVEFVESDLGVVVADHETVPANLDSINNIASFVERKRVGSSAS